MIKVSDYVVEFLRRRGIEDIFLISGGGCIHLVDSIGKSKMRFICNLHEQACAMAMEGYARARNDVGACLVTTGPGATNAITGLIGAWLDSVPSIVISGQVKRSTMRTAPGCDPRLRQLGDQEINIVDIVRPVTKYAVTVMEPGDIRFHLEKAFHLAKSDRPGPAWVDIPLDVQGAMVDENALRGYEPEAGEDGPGTELIGKQADEALRMLREAKRPVLLVGRGVRLAKAEKEFLRLVELLRIPVLASFSGYDLIAEDNPYYYGREGTLGQRRGNFVIQNSDVVLALGTRMNLRVVSFNMENFAREAKKIVVDIDPAELGKPTIKPDLAVNADAGVFIKMLLERLGKGGLPEKAEWLAYADRIYEKYAVPLKEQREAKGFVDMYVFANELSGMLKGGETVVVSNGSACIAPYQAFEVKDGQTVIVNSGCASMGYGLPAAIGACVARGRREVFCIEGDGSLQMNIQELQTLKHYNLPVKMFVINNRGYLSIRETQRNLFKGKFVASGEGSGVTCPDLEKIAHAYGLEFMRVKANAGIKDAVRWMMERKGPAICELMCDPDQGFMVKVMSSRNKRGEMVSKPLEDMWPFLPRDEFRANMIVKTVNDED